MIMRSFDDFKSKNLKPINNYNSLEEVYMQNINQKMCHIYFHKYVIKWNTIINNPNYFMDETIFHIFQYHNHDIDFNYIINNKTFFGKKWDIEGIMRNKKLTLEFVQKLVKVYGSHILKYYSSNKNFDMNALSMYDKELFDFKSLCAVVEPSYILENITNFINEYGIFLEFFRNKKLDMKDIELYLSYDCINKYKFELLQYKGKKITVKIIEKYFMQNINSEEDLSMSDISWVKFKPEDIIENKNSEFVRKYRDEIKVKNDLVTEQNRKELEEILEKEDISLDILNYSLDDLVRNFDDYDISIISQKEVLKKIKQYFDGKNNS